MSAAWRSCATGAIARSSPPGGRPRSVLIAMSPTHCSVTERGERFSRCTGRPDAPAANVSPATSTTSVINDRTQGSSSIRLPARARLWPLSAPSTGARCSAATPTTGMPQASEHPEGPPLRRPPCSQGRQVNRSPTTNAADARIVAEAAAGLRHVQSRNAIVGGSPVTDRHSLPRLVVADQTPPKLKIRGFAADAGDVTAIARLSRAKRAGFGLLVDGILQRVCDLTAV